MQVVVPRHHGELPGPQPVGDQNAGVHQVAGGTACVPPARLLQGLLVAVLQQFHAQLAHRILQRGDRSGGAHRAAIADDEQITETAVEQQFHRHPRVGTTEHCRQGILAFLHGLHAFPRAVGME